MPLDSADYQQIKRILRDCLREEGVTGEAELARKWEGGTLLILAGDPNLKPKEVALDDLFHKIVMVRDRLRVLEQKINANSTLSEREKVDLQQYITRSYGSLTTFNALFQHREDGFVGASATKQRSGSDE